MDRLHLQILQWMNIHFSKALETYFKQLFEEKHLYQNINVEFPAFEVVINEIINRNLSTESPESVRGLCQYVYDQINDLRWMVVNPFKKPWGISITNRKRRI